MKLLPLARSRDIVVQRLENETLIYDLKTDRAYNLNETSSVVFQACDGKTSVAELREKSGFTEDVIYLALDELKKQNLLEENQSYDSPFKGMSRREAIRKIGLASAVALPVITFLVAPSAAAAASACPGASPGRTCACVAPGDCITQTICPSTVNCNPSKCCAP